MTDQLVAAGTLVALNPAKKPNSFWCAPIRRTWRTSAARETPIEFVPAQDGLDVAGLDITPEQITAALEVNVDGWRAEIKGIEEWSAKLGPETPTALHDELDTLRSRLGAPLSRRSNRVRHHPTAVLLSSTRRTVCDNRRHDDPRPTRGSDRPFIEGAVVRTHAITPDTLAAWLAPLGDNGYDTRMAVAILLTPDERGGLVADAAADYVLVGDSVPASVDWSGLLLAIRAGAVGVDRRTAQLLRLATSLALNQR